MMETDGFTYHMPGEFIDAPTFEEEPAYSMGEEPDLADAMHPDCEAALSQPQPQPQSQSQSQMQRKRKESQSAEALLLKTSLALGTNNLYRVPFSKDFDDDFDDDFEDGFGNDKMSHELQQANGTAEYTLSQPEPSAQPMAQSTAQTNMAMGVTFDVSSFASFAPADGSRPSISSSSRTHTSNASHDTTATATAPTFAQPTLSDYSIVSGSYTSLLSAGSANSGSSANTDLSSLQDLGDADKLSDEAVEDSDDGDLPSIDLFRNKDGTLGTEGLVGAAAANDIDDAIQWTKVAAPAALLEVPNLTGIDAETAPDLLRAILQSSVESVQAQVPLLQAAVASLQEGRERQRRHQEEEEAKAASGKSKGKEVMADSTATLRPPPSSATATTASAQSSSQAQQKKSKRQMLASTFRRLRGNPSAMGNGNGESSSQGAAAAAMQRHNQMMASRSVTPGFKWVRSEHGQKWELVADTSDGGDSSNLNGSELAVAKEPGMAPISEGRRKTMLLAMVKQDMAKKKEVVPPQTIECISCFEDIPTKQAVKTVCHSYCLDCFAQLVSTAVANEAQFPPKCCLNEIPSKTVTKYAPRDIARLYSSKQDEFSIPVADRVYCPTVDCGVFVPPNQVSAAARTAHCRNGHETCTACRQPTHGRNNREACPEASAQDRRDQQLADNLAAEEGWRRCISCAVMIEHREACQHMTCRCGAEFCYVCGERWHTCDCTMDDLRALKDTAAGRRQARASRERHEEELAEQADRELQEVRDALRQVEEFERQETERIAAERAVQRQRLQALKKQREAMLRIETESKYTALRSSLASLTASQMQNARQARRSERVAQRAAHIQERRQLAEKHADECAAGDAAAAEAIRQGEDFWQADYRARLALEQRLEALYKNKVQATGTDAKKALREYQRQNDNRLDDYLKWKDRELAQMRFHAEEARDVRAEVLDSLKRKHVRTQRAEQRALAQRHRCERVWCRVVQAERERLLAEAEEVERGLGLAGSSSETDTTLLVLLEMDESGGLDFDDFDAAGGDLETGAESSHMYAVLFNDMAGQMEGLGYDGYDGYDVGEANAAQGASAVNVHGRSVVGEEDWEDANNFYSAGDDSGSTPNVGRGRGSPDLWR